MTADRPLSSALDRPATFDHAEVSLLIQACNIYVPWLGKSAVNLGGDAERTLTPLRALIAKLENEERRLALKAAVEREEDGSFTCPDCGYAVDDDMNGALSRCQNRRFKERAI